MIEEIEIVTFAEYCKNKLNFSEENLGDEYYYQSLPFCIIDAIFSIGVRYSSTQNTISRFCNYFGLDEISKEILPISDQLSVSEFVDIHQKFSFEEMANIIYQNRQRTSTRNGILKAEAVFLFAKILQKFDVNYFHDVHKILGKSIFELEVSKIPGQSSGISTRYFYMLAGSDDYIKPDRMVTRFIKPSIKRNLSLEEIHDLIIGAHKILVKDFPHLTPKSVDHQIWLYQREIPNNVLISGSKIKR